MEKAKEFAKEIIQDMSDGDFEISEQKWDRLKPRINELVYEYLPLNTTVKEMEIITVTIFDIISNPDKYLKQ